MGKHKKKSKNHKEKKHKKYKKKHYSSSNSSSTSEDEWIEKKKKHYSSSDTSSTSEDEWVEKRETTQNSSRNEEPKFQKPNDREDWMSFTSLPGLFSHKETKKQNEEQKRLDKESSKYNPKTSVRELNPYWKDNGDGLPTAKTKFIKPSDDNNYKKYSSSRSRSSNWRKKSPQGERRHEDDSKYSDYRHRSNRSPENERSDYKHIIREVPTSSKTSDIIYESEDKSPEKHNLNKEEITSDFLTDKEMNELAAKIVKAEILGNTTRVSELKDKLERARTARLNPNNQKPIQEEEVLLTKTTSKGFSRPLDTPTHDPYDKKGKRKVINTHDSGKRQKYYPDDEKYSLQNMFQNEKYGNNDKQDEEFMKAASKLAKADDLEDMFMDNIRKKGSEEKESRKERDRAIREHQIMSQTLDNCQNCIQSTAMQKHLMVSLGETIFLSLPQYDPLTEGHCFILPIRHVTCSTQLDENEWSEVLELRKCLTKMFQNQQKTVIFYELATNLNRYPHMLIHCVPVPEEQGDLAPIYFKKAIDECEMEWSTNKKLINMSGKDVRRCVPKGLPYFWVSFGMKEGFAHVIEEQKYFPKFFAEEIIGGILDLHHSKWRKSAPQKFDTQKQRVIEFSKVWKEYDYTQK